MLPLPSHIVNGLNRLEKAFIEDYYRDGKLDTFDLSNLPSLQTELSPLAFRSDVLAWCLSTQFSPFLKKIHIKYVTFTKPLDLNYHQLPFPMHFTECVFLDRIYLNEALTKSITFEKCKLSGIEGNNIEIRGSLSLYRSKVTKSDVQFKGGMISGSIVFSGTSLLNNGANVLDMDLIQCRGSLVFDEGFQAEGKLSIMGAKVGGSIDMHQATLKNLNNTALLLANTTVESNIFFTGGFKCEGRISLKNASVKGNVELEQATLENPQQTALHADALDCNGSVFIRGGSSINGEIRLPGASIERVLEIRDAELFNRDRVVFNGEGMVVNGTFEWRHFKKSPEGRIILNSARVGILADDESGWPIKRELNISGFDYRLLGGSAPVDYEKRKYWLSRQESEVFQSEPYENLAIVLKRMGYQNQAKAIAILKSRIAEKSKSGLLNKLKGYILKVTVDYGYNPGKIFGRFIIPYLLIGWIVFQTAYKQNIMIPSKDRVYVVIEEGGKMPRDYSSFNALIYSVDSFFPLFDLHQQEYWQPSSMRPNGYYVKIYLWIHIISGWLLTTIAVVGYTGIIKKDIT